MDLDTPDGGNGLKRACDQCRARKIRCDKGSPCYNCQVSQKDCSWTNTPQKIREPKQRWLISHQYEEKIDRFETRFTGLENMIRDLAMTLNSTISHGSEHEQHRNTHRPSASSPKSGIVDQNTDVNYHAEFEGKSSMAAHTMFASDFIERAATNDAIAVQSGSEMQKALQTLQRLARIQNKQNLPHGASLTHKRLMPTGGYSQLPLPPANIVLACLREMKADPPIAFSTNCTFIAVDDFCDYCQQVYFATEQYSLAKFIIVNAGLYYIFQEKEEMGSIDAGSYTEYRGMCRDNIETALSNLPLLLPPDRETVEALLLAATYTIETANMALSWQLNSTAALMCQTLGWHSLQEPVQQSQERNISAFWFCYMLDKCLSLRLGRSSVLQDWDISVQQNFSSTSDTSKWTEMLNLWIRTGSILGEIYEKLYSPKALQMPLDERCYVAHSLVDKRRQLWNQLTRLTTDLEPLPKPMATRHDESAPHKRRAETIRMILRSGEVSHLSSMTLIYRAIPMDSPSTSTFNPDCIEAARMAIARHHECMDLTSGSLSSTAGYLHWTLLLAPFTPYIVLFCHVIETCNPDDLKRLGNFSSSLADACKVSKSIERLAKVCHDLHQVASLYVREKEAVLARMSETMVHPNLDQYLSQLGFINPQQLRQDQNYQSKVWPTTTGEQSDHQDYPTSLGQWFSSNKCIMGLMDEDMIGWVDE